MKTMKTALQLIVFYVVVAGLLCCVNGHFSSNIAELKNSEGGNIQNCIDNGFKSIVLPSDNKIPQFYKIWLNYFQKRFSAFNMIKRCIYDQGTHFCNIDANKKIKNLSLIPTNQNIHPKLTTRKLEKNIFKRIKRIANLTVIDNSTNVPDILIHLIASNVSMIKNQTESNLNLSTTSIPITKNNTDIFLASFTTRDLPYSHTRTEQINVSTHEDTKKNIMLPFSSNQNTYFYNPLKIFFVFGVTIITSGIFYVIYKRLQGRVNRHSFHVGGTCHDHHETIV